MHDMREDIDNQFQFVDEIWEDEFWFAQGLKVGGSLRRTTDSDFMVLSSRTLLAVLRSTECGVHGHRVLIRGP